MTVDHPHVGPLSADQYGITCGYSGLTPDGPVCGKPSVIHVAWYRNGEDLHASTACATHADYVRAYGIIAEHPIAGSACCMPGSVWVEGPPSKCVIDDSGTEPELLITRELEVSR